MITGRAIQADGKPMLLIGLTLENMGQLVDGKPIDLSREKLARLGFPDTRVVIMGGINEDEMAASLREGGFITGGTDIRDLR